MRAEPIVRHHVHGASQYPHKILLDPDEIQERASRFHIYEQVDIARVLRLATRHRPEKARISPPMPGNDSQDLGALAKKNLVHDANSST